MQQSHMQILKPSDFQTFTENLKLVPLNYGLNKSGLTLLLWNYLSISFKEVFQMEKSSLIFHKNWK